MTRQYFGTDGIRGEVGKFPIVPDFVMRLGYAAGQVLAKNAGTHGKPTVLIGKDTRVSGYLLEAALEAGFSAAGVDVMLCGPMPTPAVAYLTRTLRLSAGVVISASHNPYHDNGIKFFSANGDKLDDAVELQIEAALNEAMNCVDSAHLGKAKRLDDATGRYIEFCKSTFPNHLSLHGLKLVVDCAHGAAYHIAPHVFHELGAEVVSIGIHPNGKNINDGVGATAPKALIEKVKEEKADLGIALDGDAHGRLFNGDELLYLIAKARKDAGETVKGVVGTLMTNMAVEKAIQAEGIQFERAKVGDRYVLEKLKENNWQLGGEGSGHLICLDKHTTGDGIVAALQVLSAMKQNQKTLAQLLEKVTLFPQTLINVKYKQGYDWKTDAKMQEAITQAEKNLNGSGRVLIRPSGTEPLLRVMVEAQDAHQAQDQAKKIAQTIPV
jgi:phosphoglucosamine mutase